jgi:DNA-binding transcriptional LysR family regulator
MDDRRAVQLQFLHYAMRNPNRMLGIEARHLAALETVAETGSFARAARELGYTQSAVSLQIAALERAAGTRLLLRPTGRRPVVPTEAGERLLRHARRVVAQLEAADADLRALATGAAGSLRIGTFQSVSVRVLPGVVRAFRERYPGIDVRLHEEPYDDVLTEQLERGRLDLAFCPQGVEGPFDQIELLRDPYVLLAPEDSPLAGLTAAPTLREIGRLPLIAYGRSSYGVEARLRSQGIEPDVVFRTDESRALQRLVGAGVGHAVVPLMSIDAPVPGMVIIDASRRVPPRRLGIAWHRDVTLPEAAHAFLDVVVERCAEVQQELDGGFVGRPPERTQL